MSNSVLAEVDTHIDTDIDASVKDAPVAYHLLMELADFLMELPRDRFNYSVWAESNDLSKCGTVACAAGWATTLPSFQDRGLFLGKDPAFEGDPSPAVCFNEGAFIARKKVHFFTIDALALVLEISLEDAEYLFLPSRIGGRPGGNASAREVAEHIRAYAEKLVA